jgi:hypothetical protein
MVTINYAEEIGRYRIEDWIASDLGDPEGKSGKWRLYCCPFHGDTDPSFGIDTEKQRATCFSGCTEGSIDLLDYIQLRRFGSINKSGPQVLEALKVLTGNSFLAPVNESERRVLKDNKPTTPPPTMAEVMKYAQWGDMAVSYFNQRMVSGTTVKERLLGCEMEHAWKTEVKSTGQTFRMIRRHYTIPNILGTTVRGINTRRDDAFCEVQLMTDKGQEAYKQVAGEIADKKHCSILDVRREKVIDKLFGPKYWKVPGSHGAIFNAQRLLKLENGQPIRLDDGWMVNRMPYVLVVEAEIGAMSLEDAGYPAVAVSQYYGIGLDKPFKGARRIVIIGDNDIDRVNQYTGLPWNAGQSKAQQAAFAIRPGTSEIIYPPGDYKDPNEVAQAGGLKTWLAGYNISPTMSARISK